MGLTQWARSKLRPFSRDVQRNSPISDCSQTTPARIPLPADSSEDSYVRWMSAIGFAEPCDLDTWRTEIRVLAGWDSAILALDLSPDSPPEAALEMVPATNAHTVGNYTLTPAKSARSYASDDECLVDIVQNVRAGTYLGPRAYADRWRVSESEASKRIKAFREADLVSVTRVSNRRLITRVNTDAPRIRAILARLDGGAPQSPAQSSEQDDLFRSAA